MRAWRTEQSATAGTSCQPPPRSPRNATASARGRRAPSAEGWTGSLSTGWRSCGQEWEDVSGCATGERRLISPATMLSPQGETPQPGWACGLSLWLVSLRLSAEFETAKDKGAHGARCPFAAGLVPGSLPEIAALLTASERRDMPGAAASGLPRRKLVSPGKKQKQCRATATAAEFQLKNYSILHPLQRDKPTRV